MPSYDNKVLTGDQLVYFSGLVKTALAEKASTSAVSAKQDALVFNTAYNASTNPVATMADIPTTTEYTADLSQTMGAGTSITSQLTAMDGISSAISNSGNELYKLSVSAFGMSGEDNVNSKEVNVGIGSFVWTDNSGSSPVQVSLTPGTNYDGLYVNNSKVATMADITTALGGISSFSFEIVQSLPQSNISTSKIYLVAKQTSGTNQVYTEYAYVNNGWEIIGDTSMTIDTLSNQEVATIWSAASAT